MGRVWDSSRIIIRSGSPLVREHLERVRPRTAAAAVIPSGDFTANHADFVDTTTVKTLLSLGQAVMDDQDDGPLVVAELRDERNVSAAREREDHVGMTVGEIQRRLDRAIIVGVLRSEDESNGPHFNVPGDLRIESGDRLILLARALDASDWLETGDLADARTITASLLLREIVGAHGPHLVQTGAEIVDASEARRDFQR
ncbi:MAG: TrkA C-terminal domain-containing protein, partial [Spirochaetota bacterium]